MLVERNSNRLLQNMTNYTELISLHVWPSTHQKKLVSLMKCPRTAAPLGGTMVDHKRTAVQSRNSLLSMDDKYQQLDCSHWKVLKLEQLWRAQ